MRVVVDRDGGHAPILSRPPRLASAAVAPPIESLTRNAVHVLPAGELERKLGLGRPLRVKLGIDVTSPEMHIGHAIPLQRMRAFQDAGHVGVLIVGDYTTRIGDPSGRSSERPVLSDEEIDANAQRYFEQADAHHRRRPGAARGALQRRMAARARLRRRAAPDPNGHRGALARARRLREALRGERADLGLRAPLPAHAGLRLGRGPGGRRARRHRPALQPARRAATSWRPTASSPRSP